MTSVRSDAGSPSQLVAQDRNNPRLMRNEALLSLGADSVSHSGKTLLAHLEGVEQILRSWGACESTCAAGLFHSVYGTESFKRPLQSRDSRSLVEEAIGPDAERLVYIFGGLQVASLREALKGVAPFSLQCRWSDEIVVLSETELRQLALIFAANWVEQFPRLRASARASYLEFFRNLASWLGGSAEAAVNDIYGFNQMALEIDRSVKNHSRDAASEIEIWDDAVPQELMTRLSGLVDQNMWRYGWKARSEQSAYGFWHCHFGGDDGEEQKDCIHDLFGRPLVKPLLDLWRMLEAGPLRGHTAVRIYANAHTFGGDGHLHLDHKSPGNYTTIYYAHPLWAPNWAGETVFFNAKEDDIIKAVYPRPGRLVHFPGTIPHAARSPGRECPTLRAVLVIKTIAGN